ncbi:MAG: UDP-3-O-acyl-N-acetylglucosamine deacetylase [Candidatus Omnitrophota bacterium]
MEKQRTIIKEARFSGKALQTGVDVDVICRPSGGDTGIVFKRSDLEGAPAIRLGEAEVSCDLLRRSTVSSGEAAVQTVEHFLAALWALGIDNIQVEINGAEMPAMDGSAVEFLRALKTAGVTELAARRRAIKVRETERVEGENGGSITVSPSDIFSVSYLIDYDAACIGRETFKIDLDSGIFEKEIAPARTFCLKSEAEALLKEGFGRGATCENTLVMDDNGPAGTALRFKNEPVRHKILDLVGDLYLLGRPVIGRVDAEKSGHGLNAAMVRKLREKYMDRSGRVL